MLGKIAIIGDGDSIMVFKATGIDAYPAENETKAKEILRRIAKDYKVIFISEPLAKLLEEYLKRFEEEAYPVVVPMPIEDGSTYAEERLKSATERALGVDIQF